MKLKNWTSCLSVLLFFLQSYAANITNSIQGVGPNGAIRPFICIQNTNGQVTLPLAPDKSGDANTASGNTSYAGGAIRFDGCVIDNDYLGYLGLSIGNKNNPTISGYTAPPGVHIAYINSNIDAQGNLSGAIAYTSILPNFSFLPARTRFDGLFVGINLSGLEFGKSIAPSVIPNLSEEDAATQNSDLTDTQAFIQAGMNTVRLPISWDYLQWDGPGVGQINADYYDNFVKPLLETLTSANVYTIVDLHAYMRYSTYGQQYSGCGASGACPDGKLILDENAYISIWRQLWEKIKNNPNINANYLLFDLVNEPVDVPDDKVFTIQTAVIKMLREQQFDGYILVEGNAWSGLHSWTTAHWKSTTGENYTNATLFTRDNFIKAGVTDLSKILINVHQYLDSDYSGTHNDCLQDLSTTGDNGFNLSAFTTYLAQNKLKAIVTEFGAGTNAQSCEPPLKQFLTFLKNNNAQNHDSGFVGWTVWSTGHGWGNYNLRVTPNSYQTKILKGFLTP
jgi:endoglucanase